MPRKEDLALKNASPYSAVITRERFLFYETRTTARLLTEGNSQEGVIQKIVDENLFQYPIKKSVRRVVSEHCWDLYR